jgi:hypothetical protein
MMLRIGLLALLVAGCADQDHGDGEDVVGPFEGETRRFVVDRIELPLGTAAARELGGDLDGDGDRDNQLGLLISTLAGQGNVTTHGDEMIAAGSIGSSVEITADDFSDSDRVGVRFIGSEADRDSATVIGGRFSDARFLSNRTATTQQRTRATAYLPVFVDADPLQLPLFGVQLELTPDPEGGGYTALVHGVVEEEIAKRAAWVGARQMVENRPIDHVIFLRLFDQNGDRILEETEFVTSSVSASLMSPDVRVEGELALSIGFRVHLTPCSAGSCASTPVPTCFDRVQNGDESDVDCGGACGACVGEDKACVANSDCETGACEGDNTCAAPSCTNGLRDGFEWAVDCGSVCGVGCALGTPCFDHADCASGQCGEPCPEGETCWPDYATCRPAR